MKFRNARLVGLALAGAGLALVGTAGAGPLAAQNAPAAGLAFTVVSVKPDPTSTSIGNHFEPNRAAWSGVPLSMLICDVFRLQSYQLEGGPAWMGSDRWDIDARTDHPVTPAQRRLMTQTLLAQRFRLRYHQVSKDLAGYALVVAKGGPKLKQARQDPNHPGGASTRIGRGLIEGHDETMEDLADWLRGELGRPLVEETGLTGAYDFKLEWVPDESQPNSGGAAPAAGVVGPPSFPPSRTSLA